MEPLSREELVALPVMTTIEMAARARCLGRTRAYELARRDQFPCKAIRIGTSYRLVTADLHRITGIEQTGTNLARREGVHDPGDTDLDRSCLQAEEAGPQDPGTGLFASWPTARRCPIAVPAQAADLLVRDVRNSMITFNLRDRRSWQRSSSSVIMPLTW